MVAKSRTSKASPKLRLAPNWVPQRDKDGAIITEGRLWDFTENIAQSRREGKNRRDGATVSTRVLRLADTLGQSLFAADAGEVSLTEMDEEAGKKKGRRKTMGTRANL